MNFGSRYVPKLFPLPKGDRPTEVRIFSASKTALEGERKEVTVLFADLKGSMDCWLVVIPRNVAKFALATASLGNVRTRTARAWPEAEFTKLISELP